MIFSAPAWRKPKLEVGADQREQPQLRGARLGERAVELGEQAVERAIEDEEEKLVLAAYIVVETGEREPRGAGDLADRGLVKAPPRDHVARRLQDAFVPLADRHPEPPPERLFGWPLR